MTNEEMGAFMRKLSEERWTLKVEQSCVGFVNAKLTRQYAGPVWTAEGSTVYEALENLAAKMEGE